MPKLNDFCNKLQPDAVVRWHRTSFKLYWSWLTRGRVRVGMKSTGRELCELIFPTVSENPTWDAPRIHVEVKMLGSDISERTILRWMCKVPRDPEPARRWAAFLRNHRKGVVRSSVDPDPSDRLFFLARNHSPIRSSSFSAAKRKRSAPGSMIKLRPLSPGWSFAHGQRENIDSLKV